MTILLYACLSAALADTDPNGIEIIGDDDLTELVPVELAEAPAEDVTAETVVECSEVEPWWGAYGFNLLYLLLGGGVLGGAGYARTRISMPSGRISDPRIEQLVEGHEALIATVDQIQRDLVPTLAAVADTLEDSNRILQTLDDTERS